MTDKFQILVDSMKAVKSALFSDPNTGRIGVLTEIHNLHGGQYRWLVIDNDYVGNTTIEGNDIDEETKNWDLIANSFEFLNDRSET